MIINNNKRGAFSKPKFSVMTLTIILIVVFSSLVFYFASQSIIEDTTLEVDNGEDEQVEELDLDPERIYIVDDTGFLSGDTTHLNPGGVARFVVEEDKVLKVNYQACEMDSLRYNSEFMVTEMVDGQEFEYHTLYQKVGYELGFPRVTAKTREERNQAFVSNNVYRLEYQDANNNISRGFVTEQTIPVSQDSELVTVRFRSKCDESLMLLKLEDRN